MKNWGRYFEICSLRSAAAQQRLRNGQLIALTSNFAMPRARFLGLAPWERDSAKTTAVGLGLRRGVLVGRSAAQLHGLATLGTGVAVEVSHLRGGKPSARECWPEGVVFRHWSLPTTQVYQEHGLRVSTLVRTAVDVARTHGLRDGVVAFDSLLHNWGISKQEVQGKMRELGRLRGLPAARQALDYADPLSESPLESVVRLVLVQAGLPQVRSIELQRSFGRYRVDMLINGWLVVEADGHIKYSDDAVQTIKKEREREKFLHNLGLRVLRIGWEDVPARLIDLVGRALSVGEVPGLPRELVAAPRFGNR